MNLYLSGGASNTDTELSIGGGMSSTFASENSLFGSVSADEYANGVVIYRKVFVQAQGTANALKVYVDFETPQEETSISIGWGGPKNTALQSIANETVAPVGVTFDNPRNADQAVSVGDYVAGDFRELWVRLTVNPGAAALVEKFSLSYATDNGPPVNFLAPEIQGEPLENATLVATPGSWTNSPLSYAYQWQESINLEGWANISGATSLVLSAVQVGKYVRIREIAFNGAGGGEPAFSSAMGPIVGGVPVIVNLPVVSGSTQLGSLLTASTGDWTNSPTGFIYAWETSPNGTTWTTAGSTDSFLLTVSEVGLYLRVRVTPSNSVGAGVPATSASVGPVMSQPTSDMSQAANSQNLIVWM